MSQNLSDTEIKQIIWEYVQTCPQAAIEASELKHLRDWTESKFESLQSSVDIEMPKLGEKVREAIRMSLDAVETTSAAKKLVEEVKQDFKQSMRLFNSLWWKLLLTVLGGNGLIFGAFYLITKLEGR